MESIRLFSKISDKQSSHLDQKIHVFIIIILLYYFIIYYINSRFYYYHVVLLFLSWMTSLFKTSRILQWREYARCEGTSEIKCVYVLKEGLRASQECMLQN